MGTCVYLDKYCRDIPRTWIFISILYRAKWSVDVVDVVYFKATIGY